MSRRQRISDANIILTNSLNLLNTRIGDLTTLDTTVKNTVVGAINELVGMLNNMGGDLIDDVSPAGDKVYSSLRTEQIVSTEIASAITTALEGEDLSDLADGITALAQADNGLVSVTSDQGFSISQQGIGRTNIGAASQIGLQDLSITLFNTGLFDTSLPDLVSAGTVQNFDATQQAQGRSNIEAASNAGLTTEVTNRQTADQAIRDDLGDTDFDFAAEINAILNV